MHQFFSGPLTVEKIPVTVNNLPPELRGLKITQLSDFHYDGVKLSEELLAEAIRTSNSMNPDLVVLTGDFVTYEPDPIHDLVKRLKRLESRRGIYAVLGNHDLYYPTTKFIVTQALTDIGIQVLWNQVSYPLGKGLALVGLPDFWSPDFNPASVFNDLDEQVPRIVLSHQPDSAEVLQQWRVDLQLSGHTHGGQIVLPELGPLIAYQERAILATPPWLRQWIPLLQRKCDRVVKHWEWSAGLYQLNHNRLYVNRGLGTYPPGRLFCPPELTAITLV
ncbi:metallophosphoesterase [Roseofilum sp. BLCC_M91]|uniref:Metallophosphoesterase n=1 Tax=Roseofilum halophilum BLCC-M91 TaxID=3022259 RepID=A0ABT7BK30_9CYAN|nr:metallophosphoesterase [Roseofilum halophilum]MDJ1179553.1 metallophosphoesterase [Roseofilum halophilum BLCC-M91]